jgi:phenylalanyl-tRNA synthetase beta chain
MGGKIYSMKLKYAGKTRTTPDLKPTDMKLDLKFINRWLGLRLKDKDAKKYLERMGYGYSAGKVKVPAYRADILHQVDLAEDIAIAYGYERFIPAIPNVATIGRESPFEAFKAKVAEILAGLGLQEVNTYNLTNRDFQCTKMEVDMPLIELANSLSSEFDVLRAWMVPSMLEIFKNNKHHDYPQRIFGIGTVFKKNPKFDTNIEENDRLCVAICSDRTDFTEIRQVLDYLFRQIDASYEVIEAVHNSFIDGRVGRVVTNKKKVAYIGEISPTVIGNFSLEMPVTVLELNLTELFSTLRY